MAIYGAGSIWDGSIEKKDQFFQNDEYTIGWDYDEAEDLYGAVTSLKAGDIIYLKSLTPKKPYTLNVKGIGVVLNPFIHHITAMPDIINAISNGSTATTFSIPVKWIIKDKFTINIPNYGGKLTNIRTATFYEEPLPFVQKEILKNLFKI